LHLPKDKPDFGLNSLRNITIQSSVRNTLVAEITNQTSENDHLQRVAYVQVYASIGLLWSPSTKSQ